MVYNGIPAFRDWKLQLPVSVCPLKRCHPGCVHTDTGLGQPPLPRDVSALIMPESCAQAVQTLFQECQETHDPNAIVQLLGQHPYHIDALLALFDLHRCAWVARVVQCIPQISFCDVCTPCCGHNSSALERFPS